MSPFYADETYNSRVNISSNGKPVSGHHLLSVALFHTSGRFSISSSCKTTSRPERGGFCGGRNGSRIHCKYDS
jgi:hypothetical protein